ncbi:hypothetical protein ABMA27_012190 [Loxostege sticticalis]|uniref:Catenin alpha n=1 Tax=Loxostege sticticalis TaxID=481309 RepID=A0ABR3H0F6_LOXSC
MTDPYGTTGTLTLKWDPKNLEIRTTSVERTLEPLVLQVTTLRPGKSKRASALVATVERATEIFIERGQTIAYENPEITQEMLAAVEEVRKAGAAMSVAAREFSEQPCASAARSAMVRAARALLSAVTRLLILADLVDVHLLLARLRTVENDLDKLKSASSQSELVESARQFGRSADELAAQAAKRQHELKPVMKDSLAAARAVLKKHSTMLLTASKVYVRHPELAAAKANRDYVLRCVCSAVDTISAVAQGRHTPANGGNRPPVEGPGELAQALDDFDERMVMEPLAYSELRTRPSLEERLESIISGAALMADSSCTRDERRERIVAECNAVRQALQDLLHEYMTNAGKSEQSEGLERAIEHMCRKTRDLRRQLRKAVVDHVSDSFLETNVPLLVLMEAARNGNEKEVEEYALVFTEHANKLVEFNEDGVKMVRHAASQIEALCPQVIMSKFAVRVDAAVSALGGGAGAALDENDFIDASRLVYDAVREIRRAVLMNRTSDDLDTDTEFEPVEDMTMETRSRSSAHTGEHGVDEYPDISGITNAREAMRKMTEEDKRKILQQVELFRREKMTFDNEVAKWDDAGNDIIMLAKHMCMIMLEMTDFTRGRGPLKTTMDVINAAKKISEAGTKLDKLTREIAEQCPESSTKQDLLAYLQRIALYCHQIQITSKVKADVQNISGELIVSGLDSATSLIQAAKNLMNAVVLTVKASYVASTKYTRQGTIASPIVVWRMKAPEKKPLIRPEKPEEVRAKVRRGSQKKQPSPIHALAEFQSPAESV